MARSNICLFFLLITFSASIRSQTWDLQFDHFNTENGLSNNSVISIVQDSLGFMWFGTSEGLNRWDGHAFKIFTYDPDDSNSISNNLIWSLFKDESQRIWIGTNYGLNLFDPHTEKFTRYRNNKKDPNSISDNIIGTLFEDSSGNIWIGTENGLNRYDEERDCFDRYFFPGQLDSVSFWWNNNTIRAINETEDRKLLLGTTNDFLIFDPKTGETMIIPYVIPEKKRWPAVGSICKDRLGHFWIGIAADGVIEYNPASGIPRLYQPDPKDPYSYGSHWSNSICEDRNGHIWIGTFDQGFNVYDRSAERFTNYKPTGKDDKNLKGYVMNCIYRDKQGNMWIGTADDGINVVPRWKKPFKHYVHNPQNPHSLGRGEVMNFFEDKDGTLWIAHVYGISLLDRNTGVFDHLSNDPQNPASMSGGALYGFCEDKYGDLWLAITPDINRLNRNTGRFKHYEYRLSDPRSHAYTYTLCCLEDAQGVMWFGTSNAGLERFNRTDESFDRFCFDPADSTSISSNMIPTLYQDKAENLWIGTSNGICRLVCNSFDREKFIRYQHNPLDSQSITGTEILSILEDRAGRLWIGTDKGLNLFNRVTNTFKAITKQDGLTSNAILGIVEDDFGITEGRPGNLWLRTRKGIIKLNWETGKLRVYDEGDGLTYCKSIENGYSAFFKTKDGKIYTGGINSLTVFHPDSLRDNPDPPNIVLTDFKINYKSVSIGTRSALQKSVTFTDEIQLAYDQNIISFEFAALDYTAPEKNLYAYKLDGVNSDWVYTDASRRYATYTSLEPGKYVFHVRGSNNDGVWSEKEASVRIIIVPPWWETSWAYGFYSLLVISLIYGAWRFQMNRLKMKHQLEMEHLHAEQLAEMDRLKSRFFTNISHEFRTPLTLISGPLERLLSRSQNEDSVQEMKIIQRSAYRLHQLIKQLLDLSRMEAGKMKLHVREENVTALLRGFVHAFESLARLKNIQLIFHSEKESIQAYIDREKLETIINNLLSNAFKFTEHGGVVQVRLKLLDSALSPSPEFKQRSLETRDDMKGILQISISDTGIGIPSDQLAHIFDRFYQVDDSFTRAQEGTGIGLALTRELVEFHRGDISVNSKVGQGTTFILRLPAGREHFTAEEIVDSPFTKADKDSNLSEVLFDKTDSEYKTETTRKIPKKKFLPLLLIIEDNADMRAYIRDILENDYRLIESDNGMDGLRKSAKVFPDLIISDVMMSKMDGFQLCANLKTDPRTSHIPVILLTARAAAEDKIAGLETGADDYIMKPFNARELQVRVKNLIEQRRKLRERFRKEGIMQPPEIAVTSTDQRFLKKVVEVVEKHISDEQFTVEKLGKEIGMSRALLHRKLRALTDHSASEFIRSLRLNHAAQLLTQQSGNVTEIAYQVGFNNLSYFARCFQRRFGVSPSLYTTKNTNS